MGRRRPFLVATLPTAQVGSDIFTENFRRKGDSNKYCAIVEIAKCVGISHLSANIARL
jgi:hypothetical protein